MIEISVVIPVYQAETVLMELHRRLSESLAATGQSHEIIFVDDRSTDASWQKIEELVASDSAVIGIRLSKNFGQHPAITAGLHSASGNWIVVMDCDLQDQPEGISELYKAGISGFDVVLAKRANRQDGYFKKFSSFVFYKVFQHFTNSTFNSAQGNFGIYSKKVINNVLNMKEQNRSFGLLVNWLGFKSTTIELVHSARLFGKSTYSFRKRLNLAVDSITSYSNRILTILIEIGTIFSLTSFCSGLYLIYRYLVYGIHTPGWTSVIITLCFIGGMLMAANGILGLYIGKVFNESKHRPIFVIDEQIKKQI